MYGFVPDCIPCGVVLSQCGQSRTLPINNITKRVPWESIFANFRQPPDYSSCVRLKHLLYDFWGGFGASFLLFFLYRRPKHPPKESLSKCLRRTQIRWVTWRSSNFDGALQPRNPQRRRTFSRNDAWNAYCLRETSSHRISFWVSNSLIRWSGVTALSLSLPREAPARG